MRSGNNRTISNPDNNANGSKFKTAEKIIETLDNAISGLNKSEPASVSAAISTLRYYVEQSKNFQNMEQIRNALLYLSQIQFVGGFLDSPKGRFKDVLKTQYLTPWLDNNSEKIQIPSKFHKLFGSLYVSLIQIYQPGWSCSYTAEPHKDGTPEIGITSPAIRDWQEEMMVLSSSEGILADIGRGIFIKDVSAQSNQGKGDVNEGGDETKDDEKSIKDGNEKIETQKDMTDVYRRQITAFVNASNYPEDEKALIETWLLRNGGQSNYQLFDTLIRKGEFPNPSRGNTGLQNDLELGSGPNKGTGNCWDLENGSIVFAFTRSVHMLQVAAVDLLLYDKDTVGPDKYRFFTYGNFPYNRTDDALKLPPVMEFSVKIKLVIDSTNPTQKVVKPIVTVLDVKSNTDYVSLPARFQNMSAAQHTQINRPSQS